MNNFLCNRLLVIPCIITLTTHTIFADLRRAIGDLSKKPSDICSNIKTPFKKIGKQLAPCIPDAHADITLPLASCALMLISRQILPEVSKTKNVQEHQGIKAGIATLNLALGIASFNTTWTKGVNEPDGTLEDPLDWTLKNGLSTFLIASNAYTLYNLSCSKTK